MRGRFWSFPFGVFASLVAYVPNVEAYCRATTCDRSSMPCQTDAHGCLAEGEAAWWSSDTGMELWADSEGSLLRNIAAAELEHAVSTAVSTWSSALCSEDSPSIVATTAGVLENGAVGFEPGGTNTSLVRFYDTGWPFDPSAVARTLLTMNLETGEILDADILLNSESYAFALNPAAGEVDLVAVLVHELGHAVGLDHTDMVGATMQPESSGFGTPDLITLESDDIEGLCAAYPVEASDEPIGVPDPNPTTNDDRASNSSGGGCALVHRHEGRTPMELLAMLAGLALIRRRVERVTGSCTRGLRAPAGSYPSLRRASARPRSRCSSSPQCP